MKQPFIIHILWHPRFDDGEKYAKEIYSLFSRDVENPFSRGIGIPVYFGAFLPGASIPKPIDFKLSKRTATIVLVDDEMVIDQEWHHYINDIIGKTDGQHLLYPVAFTGSAFKMSGEIPETNFISLFDIKGDKKKPGCFFPSSPRNYAGWYSTGSACPK